jgi:tetratricopeptide (TPR) repeat protein
MSSWSVGVVVALAFGLAAPRPVSAQAVDPQVLQGHRLIHEGALAEAERHFDRLVTERPDDLAARFGRVYAEHGRLDVDTALAPAFERRLDALIDVAYRRYRQRADDRDALFYLAQCYMLRATYRFEHDKGMWGAARDGANAKDYSEEYVRRHPGDTDAYLTLGLYNYFVDLAPTFFKLFRFLLFLPAGNRVEGLRQIERAAQSPLFGPRAEQVLVEIYVSLEGRPADARALAERRLQRFPRNDKVAMDLANLYAGPAFEDRERAATLYQQIADRRRPDTSVDGVSAFHRARQALAAVRADQWRIAEAIDVLTPAIEAGVRQPDWVLPTCLLLRGNYRALLNDPAAADDAKRVRGDPAWTKWHDSAATLISWIAARTSSGEAATYAALIPGNRLAVEGRWDEARRAYDAIQAARPQDPQVRFRMAHLLFLSGQTERALADLTPLASGRGVPDWLRAAALLDIARAHDLVGRRDQAKTVYQRIVDSYETQRAAQAAKLGLITPYRRPQAAAIGPPR